MKKYIIVHSITKENSMFGSVFGTSLHEGTLESASKEACDKAFRSPGYEYEVYEKVGSALSAPAPKNDAVFRRLNEN